MNTYTEGYRMDGHGDVTYRVYGDGQVVAYGTEVDPVRSDLYRASAWDKHPLDHDDAQHLTHLCADAPHGELRRVLARWDEIVQAHKGDAAVAEWHKPDTSAMEEVG